jgi:FlaA1/EpsC-like NDP-sugar epimerase
MSKLLKVSKLKRFSFFLFADAIIICGALYLSLLNHFEFDATSQYWEVMKNIAVYFILLKILALLLFGVYRITWRYVGISDITNIFLAVLIAELIITVLSTPNGILSPMGITGLSKRVFFMDGMLSLCFISGLRISKRLYYEVIYDKRRPVKKGLITLIIGAGNTGEMLLRDIMRLGYKDFYPI